MVRAMRMATAPGAAGRAAGALRDAPEGGGPTPRAAAPRRTRGFTLVETLVAATVIVILTAVAFMNVFAYQRALKQLELDGIAKEILVAAQNHLTMADSQGLLKAYEDEGDGGGEALGASDGTGDDVRHFTYPATDPDADPVLNLMLPYASVEEGVRRGGGSYVISYQPSSGMVLNVFYADDGRYPHSFEPSEYDALMGLTGEEHALERRDYGSDRAVIGWYGSSGALKTPRTLKKPQLEVVNDDILYAKVANPNVSGGRSSCQLDLVVTGETSGARKTFGLVEYRGGSFVRNAAYTEGGSVTDFVVVLDDVTQAGSHFAEVFAPEGGQAAFIPGEDLALQAIARDNTQLSAIASTAEVRTNSLFGYAGPNSPAATVASVRHLENLDPTISGLKVGGGDGQLALSAAAQGKDLAWTDDAWAGDAGAATAQDLGSFAGQLPGFRERVLAWRYQRKAGSHSLDGLKEALDSGVVQVHRLDGTRSAANTYLPVSPGYQLDYQGEGHSVSNVVANVPHDAGMFGELAAHSQVSDLTLLNFDVMSTGASAGALAGALNGARVSNVLARNRGARDELVGINGAQAAGGLVGDMWGGEMAHSAAALYVASPSGTAGGLVGNAHGAASLEGSYSGGHTSGGAYAKALAGPGRFNVQAHAGAGGLVGTAEAQVAARGCYSTCSAYGSVAGGLVGVAQGGTYASCYATGLVGGPDGAVRGAFAGRASGTSFSRDSYLELANPLADGATTFLAPLGGERLDPNVQPGDDSVAAFARFAPATSAALPYDHALVGAYPYRNIEQLMGDEDASEEEGRPTATHYGDWPSVETRLVNRKG